MIKLILIIILDLLICFNYNITCYFYPDKPDTINANYDLRANIYGGMFLCAFLIVCAKSNEKYIKWIALFSYIGLALSSSDILDRIFGNYNFNLLTDGLLIITSIIFGYFKYFKINLK